MTSDARRAHRAVRPIAAIVSALWACVPVTPPTGTPTCATMCASYRSAGCSAGEPSPRLHITCEERCEAQLASGAVAPPLACVTRAGGNADAIRACGQRCLP